MEEETEGGETDENESRQKDEDGDDAEHLREELEETRDSLERKKQEVEILREQLAERDDRVEQLESRIKQVRADFENYKKRSDEKIDRAAERATEDVLKGFLGVRDDLERAIESEGDMDDIRDGLEMTLETFDRILEDHGVERVGIEEFDPQKHEAVARVESPGHKEGEVVDVYEHGYERNGSVLREAKVTVAGGEEKDTSTDKKESNDE